MSYTLTPDDVRILRAVRPYVAPSSNMGVATQAIYRTPAGQLRHAADLMDQHAELFREYEALLERIDMAGI